MADLVWYYWLVAILFTAPREPPTYTKLPKTTLPPCLVVPTTIATSSTASYMVVVGGSTVIIQLIQLSYTGTWAELGNNMRKGWPKSTAPCHD